MKIEERTKKILDNENLIWFVINKMNLGFKGDELYDLGMIGLIKAVDTFDENKGYKFTSYAVRCISNEIYNDNRKFKNEPKELISIDAKIPHSEGLYFIDIIEDTHKFEEQIEKQDMFRYVIKFFNKLTQSQRTVLELSYGLFGKRIMNNKEIAAILGCSNQWVSAVKKRAINKIRKELLKFEN